MCMTERLDRRDRSKSDQPSQRGFTLIELIIFIVVVGVGMAGILSVMNTAVKSSADPMLRKQSIAIAESMLEEILLKEYTNALGAQSGRANWNLVTDAHNYSSTGIKDPKDIPIAGLERYNISVRVVTATAADNAQLAGLTPPAYRVAVTVTDPGGTAVTLSGYKTSY